MTPSSNPSVAAQSAALSALTERTGSRIRAAARQASGVEPYALEVGLVEGMHAVIHNLRSAVVIERQPVGLDDDAGILQDFLEVLHHHHAGFRIRNGQGFFKRGVEFRVGISALVPRLAGAVGK